MSALKLAKSILYFSLFGIMTSCSATSGVTKAEKPEIVFTDLVDLLRSKPGLDITGAGASANIKIRGVSTLIGDTRPMFYLNDVPAGRDFGSIYGMINIHEVESVQILPRSRAAKYGDNGDNGIIMITTKG